MKLKKALTDLVRAVIDEAERNPEFAHRIEQALGLETQAEKKVATRPVNRRAPAVLDPVDLARQGEAVLRARLAELNLEQLKDIVAEWGMDSGKLVLKWKDSARMTNHIIEFALRRVKKGSAFLS
jgi:hypothetical protein